MDTFGGDRFDQPHGNRSRLALLILLAFALAALWLWLFRTRVGFPSVPKAVTPIDASYAAFEAAADQAETISDPMQRCLRYPDLPGSHWDVKTTAAYCLLRTRHTMALSEIESLLQQHKAADVDRMFQGYLDLQQHDRSQPGVLDQAMINAGFDDASAHTRSVIEQWKQQSPNSAFALAASGIQYVDAAQTARGNGWARDMTEEQADGMHQQLRWAHQELDRAATLQPAITTVYASMIAAGAMEDDNGYAEQAAARGVAVDPADLRLRGIMMVYAQRKWGHLFGGLAEQSREIAPLVSHNPLLQLLVGTPAVDAATCDCMGSVYSPQRLMQAADGNLRSNDLRSLADEAYNHNANKLAVALYSEAIRFNPADVDALQWRAYAYQNMGDYAAATGGLAVAAERFPDNSAIGVQLGLMYAHTNQPAPSEQAFLAVLRHDPDNKEAMANLGDLYNHAAHQPDKAEALADILISKYPDYAGGYILRACNQMDHNLPGAADTLHFFIDHFGDMDEYKTQTAEMRAYLRSHAPKPASS